MAPIQQQQLAAQQLQQQQQQTFQQYQQRGQSGNSRQQYNAMKYYQLMEQKAIYVAAQMRWNRYNNIHLEDPLTRQKAANHASIHVKS